MTKKNKFNKISETACDGKRTDCGFLPLSGYSQKMRADAARKAKAAFANGREQIYLAMTVLHGVMSYARDRGLVALAGRDYFMEDDDEPYVLDVAAGTENGTIPLRNYLELGLRHISNGEQPEAVEELLSNRYFANGYAAEDAFTACIYCIGMVGMAYGVCFGQLMEYFFSLIPDGEEDAFNKFAEEKKKLEDKEKYRQMCRSLKQKFEAWDADSSALKLDKNSLMTTFNELFGRMDDGDMKKLLAKVCNTDICYSLLGAYEDTRKRIMGMVTEKLRFILMEDLTIIPFEGDADEKCRDSMGRIIKVWAMMGGSLQKTDK